MAARHHGGGALGAAHPGQAGDRAGAEGILRTAITSCPGVAARSAFQLTVRPDRTAALTFTVTTAAGEPVTITDFVAGGTP